MSVVTISRGSYSYGKEVAEKVAQKLGYECISRDVLIEASKEFNVPQIALVRAMRDAPSILDRFTFGKERYVAYVRAALLEHLQKDNVVYHGFAGHFFVRNIAHVLKVRILAESKERVRLVMQRDAIADEAEALRVLKDIDETRRKWSLYLYGIDTHDPGLYDLLIHIKELSSENAADIICRAVALNHFQATAQSQQEMDDLLLAARVETSLIQRYPRVVVAAKGGIVYVRLEGGGARDEKDIRSLVELVPGVKQLEVSVFPFLVPD